jgi:hypothetical protein
MALTARQYFALPAESVSPAIEAAFYGSLKMRNNTFKLTSASRFAELERKLAPVFERRASAIREVLDIGVSAGVTTVELAEFLQSNGSTARITATDLFIDAHILQVYPGIVVFADSTGWPLQYEIMGTAIRPWIRRLDYFTLMFVPRKLFLEKMRRRAGALISDRQGRPVRMISRALDSRRDIEFVQNNVLENAPDLRTRFDFVRAANVLNSNYFNKAELNTALGNIKTYLRGPGSLVLITRTNRTNENAGSLFEYHADGSLQVLSRIGAGSEIETLVTQHAS